MLHHSILFGLWPHIASFQQQQQQQKRHVQEYIRIGPDSFIR